MSRGIVPIGAACLVLAVTVASFWWWAVEPVSPPGDEVSMRGVVGRAGRGVALLENEEFDAAIPEFEALRSLLPRETFATRNLAIALLGRREQGHEPDRSEGGDRLPILLDELAERTDDAVPYLLSSRLAEIEGRTERRIADLERALAADGDDAATHVDLWRAALDADDARLRERGQRALIRAHELVPDNLYVLAKLLFVRAERREGVLADEARDAARRLEPFATSIERRAGVDVRGLLDELVAAVEAEDWPRTSVRARQVDNVMQAESVYASDRRAMDRHLLSFVADVPVALRERVAEVSESSPIEVRFVERDVEVPEINGPVSAVLLRDVDLDGRLDACVLTAFGLRILAQRADGGFETIVAAPFGPGYVGLLSADLDTDPRPVLDDDSQDAERSVGHPPVPSRPSCSVADPDFVVWGPAGVWLLENRSQEAEPGSGVWSMAQGVPVAGLRGVTACALADFDHDGDLDLVVASEAGLSLLAGRGDLTYEDFGDSSSLPSPRDVAGKVTSILPVDLDEDLDVDFVVTGPRGAAGWLENLRHGNLRWRPDESYAVGEALEVVDGPMGRDWRLLSHNDGAVKSRALNEVLGAASLVGSGADSATVPGESRCVVADFDNDGRLDVVAAGDDSLTLLRQSANGRFTVDDEAFEELTGATAADFGDLDGDGDLDLVVATPSGLRVLDNAGGNANHWLRLELRAQQVRDGSETASGRVNQHGIGSVVETRAGAEWHRRIVRRPWSQLGLGPQETADAVRILWTNGIPQNIVAARANRIVCETQSLKGSCPYLYTWDGERFAFFTDLLWASPIGLQFADGVHATPRPWEHLLVPAERLVPRDGFLELRITEELWEVAYLDNVRLIAVDHPADSDVYTNEKVGPPSIGEHRLHTVTRPRRPVAIRNGQGHDLLPALGERDGVYGRAWQVRHRQGLVEEHVLEIDLGELNDPDRVTLFLTGWVFPTDTSINVALSHDPRFESPSPPALQVPDENGDWTTVVPFTGFPGGKTKTVALDLSGLFPTDDHRVRLVTNMEFAWDDVFFTVDEPPVETREEPLGLTTAALRWRGFSRERLPPGFGPHEYDYDAVSTEPRWPAIGGGGSTTGFTRYGDVRELVAEEDDRIVIMGPGDELVLRFHPPAAPPPPGWKRDYVLRNVGWDKDADLNTLAGQTVEPLPFRGMSRYPYAGVEAYPGSPVLESDRRRYHVRRQRPPASGEREPAVDVESPLLHRRRGGNHESHESHE